MTHNLETKITKNDNGYKYTTDYSLGIVPATEYDKEGERVLRIATSKRHFAKGIIESSATVITVRDSGHGYKSEQHAFGMGTGCGDYSRTIERTPCPRVTEKHIKAAHESALQHFETVLAQAIAHYANKAA
jgi:hypothetical protein